MDGYVIRQETVRASLRFTAATAPLIARGDTAGAFRATAGEFGNSFLFYYRFGTSGIGKP